ncbi:hypothetical protein D9M68_745460 [compost metagenome]
MLALVSLGDGAVQAGGRTGVQQHEALFGRVPGLEGVDGGELAVPTRRAVVHHPLALVFHRRKQLGVLERVVDGLDRRVGVGHVFRDPPAFDAAVFQRLCGVVQLAFFHGRVQRLAHGVDPGFGRHIGLAFFHHGRQRRHGVTRHQLHLAAVALGQNDVVDVGQHLGRLPVHVGHGDSAASLGNRCFGRRCGRRSGFFFLAAGAQSQDGRENGE